MSTDYEIRTDGVAVITINNPPVNALSNSVLNSLITTAGLLDKNPTVKAVVITGAGSAFVGGADILEFEMITRMGMKVDENILPKFVDAIEGMNKTVVAAINGVALGGGLELAMACHHRVAVASAKVGLPEINLGLIPGAQGTQRLPRLVPLEIALQMLMSGAPIGVDKAKKIGLIDDIVPPAASVVDEAAKIALSRPIRKVSQMAFKTVDRIKFVGGAVETALVQIEKLRRGSPAPEAIARSLRAAFTAKTFQEGVSVELSEFIKLVTSVESAALRHLFFSERLAGRIENMPKPTSKTEKFVIKKVGIVGAGFMGGGIAMCFANKGISVILLDAKDEWLQNGLSVIRKNYLSSVAKRKLTEEVANKRIALIRGSLDYSDFKDCDIVIEAVFEDMALKKKIFAQIDAVARSSALLCTNTSGLDINEIAASTKRPEAVVGTHFFSPAHIMRLLEVVRTKYSSPAAINACMEMGKRIGKISVLVGNCDGFVGNRMMGPYGAETRQLIEEGADPVQVDKAVYDFGMAMGPVSLGDMVAHDLFWRMRKNIGNMKYETKVSIGPHDLTDWLCENGRFGQKAGKGFFNYKEGKAVDKEVTAAIEAIAKRKGMKRRSISNQEIIERTIYSLINEGFKILEEGMAQRPSDVDIVYIYGYGFPPVKGGPMFFADRYIGLPKLLETLQKYDKLTAERAKANPNYPYHDYFRPSKLLVECVEKNMSLEEYWRKVQKKKNAPSKL